MNWFRTALTAVATLAFMTGMAGAGEMKKVRIGTEGAYPPFNFVDSSGKLQGFDVDISKALCEKMKVDCEFVAQDWDGIIPALMAKKYDAIIASMSITEERMKKVDFTEKYYNSKAQFIMQKGAGHSDISVAGMKGKVIGAQSSTTHSSYLEDVYKDSEIKLYGTQDEANADLASGRLDAILADSIVLYEWIKKTEEGKCCQFVGEGIEAEKWFGMGAGIAIRKEDGELKQMLNKALAEIIADGTYKAINEKYFPFSIY